MGVCLYLVIAAATVLAAMAVNRTEGLPAGTRGVMLRRSCLLLILVILAVPAILRQETGNDYLRYVEFFHLASIDAYVPTEEGFNFLVKVIYTLCGYENYLLVFAVYAVLTIGLMLLAIRQQAEDFAFSFFLFMMFGYYFQSFNTMRYYFALSIALVAMTCLLRRRYIGFLLLVILAALFHKSALVVLVLYPLALHRWKTWQRIAVCGLGAAAMVFHDKVLQLLVALYPSWEGTGDLAAGTSVSWVNIAKCAAVLILALLVLRPAGKEPAKMRVTTGKSAKRWLIGVVPGKTTAEMCKGSTEGTGRGSDSAEEHGNYRAIRLYVNGSFLALLLYVFGWFVPEMSRICYYMTFTQIFLIPMLLHRIPEDERLGILRGQRTFVVRRLLTGIVILAAVLYFALFLKTAYRDTIKILPYKSFLFHELNQTPSGSIE